MNTAAVLRPLLVSLVLTGASLGIGLGLSWLTGLPHLASFPLAVLTVTACFLMALVYAVRKEASRLREKPAPLDSRQGCVREVEVIKVMHDFRAEIGNIVMADPQPLLTRDPEPHQRYLVALRNLHALQSQRYRCLRGTPDAVAQLAEPLEQAARTGDMPALVEAAQELQQQFYREYLSLREETPQKDRDQQEEELLCKIQLATTKLALAFESCRRPRGPR